MMLVYHDYILFFFPIWQFLFVVVLDQKKTKYNFSLSKKKEEKDACIASEVSVPGKW